MIAVIFELTPAEGRFADYQRLAEELAAELKERDGFLSVERFESISRPGHFVSLSFWRDEEALRKWRNLEQHRAAQKEGRGGIFRSYRLRVAQVIRDYSMDERSQAPSDSVKAHG
jgi:heme-degrading monooxygenase HmoA